ncbi:uncharacterized protein I303_104392 [Kwoniella dejecticola CBS 10117]|uniref:F-box domain-containing protein n=1 Tax=Kwoniella dejecticola CBS 10117 TaxID=1296121 RepID=A0A1A6A5G2_9TREE|nr:uncharacterized protein I303_04630 [Kwoniella dejecticola CBS 10117]OBR85296.1 hypothetical protein I303_04630 [Kwoniella dejecticola CBS 10117]
MEIVGNVNLEFSSPGGQILPPELILHVFAVLEAQADYHTLLSLQRCSSSTYTVLTPRLYRHLPLIPTILQRLFQPFALHNNRLFRVTENISKVIISQDPVDPLDMKSQALFKSHQITHLRSLLTLVKHLTLTCEDNGPIATGLIEYSRLKIPISKVILFPNVQTIRFTGTGDSNSSWSPGLVTRFLAMESRPHTLCFARIDARAPLGTYIRMFDVALQKVIIHGCRQNTLPKFGRISLRMSYAREDPKIFDFQQYHYANEDYGLIAEDRVSAISDSIESNWEYNRTGLARPWRIFTGDGINVENEKTVIALVKTLKKKVGYGTTVEDREDSVVSAFFRSLSWTTDEEASKEPPCEICGGDLTFSGTEEEAAARQTASRAKAGQSLRFFCQHALHRS